MVIEIVDIYWWILWGSLGAAVLATFFGDIIEGLFEGLDEFLSPLLLFGTLSVIGGAGVLLTKYTDWIAVYVLLASLLIGTGAYFLIYHFMIVPMSNAESSTSKSVMDLEGKLAEVITTIPAEGMGEVFIESTHGSRNEIAKSFDYEEIKQGEKVVVVEVKEQIVYVSSMNEEFN
ncbi:NfeD-like C-terminal, partner-binding [Thalassobacillus cyri]|uniref:NfeD-like C-terminal, partner-binding n=1 Tax=Thalassobacillus cyri TaxID=571932 RepID=A0A1H4EH76_9BACI|nr:hypothetical protein [Thalassobacillus cyri]SEA84078.1 NfeD-like C-terminal, partner-binding [Thalassobacillus cyri]